MMVDLLVDDLVVSRVVLWVVWTAAHWAELTVDEMVAQ